MRASSAPRFIDLPFLIVGLSLGFRTLIRRLRSEAGLCEDVAVGMGSIFFALREDEGCIMRDLAARLRMPKGTLSGLMARMERSGWVERRRCPQDGRAQRVCLTRKARAMEAGLGARHQRAMKILQAGLKAAEVAELQRLMGHVLENLRTHEGQAIPGKHRTRRRAASRTSK